MRCPSLLDCDILAHWLLQDGRAPLVSAPGGPAITTLPGVPTILVTRAEQVAILRTYRNRRSITENGVGGDFAHRRHFPEGVKRSRPIRRRWLHLVQYPFDCDDGRILGDAEPCTASDFPFRVTHSGCDSWNADILRIDSSMAFLFP